MVISFVSGQLDTIQNDSVIIDNNGIGYEIKVCPDTLNTLIRSGVKDKNLKLYTFMSVKEEAINLYGFLSHKQLLLFNQLITVSGIGPKAAMNIISGLPLDRICFAIASEDVNLLSKIQGVGKKTAQRLILELKDKINLVSDDSLEVIGSKINSNFDESNMSDAIEALCALGYSRSQVIKTVMQIDEEKSSDLSASQIIKLALKSFSNSKLT